MRLLLECISPETTEQLIETACAHGTPAELHYEPSTGTVIIGRVRLLEVVEDQVLADRPTYPGGKGDIPEGVALTVHLYLNGQRLQFESVLEVAKRTVTLNAQQQVAGIALLRPTVIVDSQRRSSLRVSLLGYDTINVFLARPHTEIPDACDIDTQVITGQVVDISSGGMSILVEQDVARLTQSGGRFFLSFALPTVEEEFQMFGLIRHSREVKRSDSLRVGVAFRPWRGQVFRRDRQRITRFVTEQDRRMLKRRK